MFSFKKLCFILLFCLTVGVSCVSASDVDNVTVSDFDDDTLVVENIFDNITSDQINEGSILYPTYFDDISEDQINKGDIYYNPGSFDDLYNEIHSLNPGDTYVFDRDYVFDGSSHNNGGILIDLDNLIINGNGHFIDGKNMAAIFSITGNNVKIFNLTVVNSDQFIIGDIHLTPDGSWAYWTTNSAITWYGNNGVISDCTFKGNSAINGGAISWMGNNGLIDNCVFINNTARGVGGAIYIAGENNTISNSVFINSVSKLSGEAIFIDRNHKNIKIENCDFSGLAYRDGQKINFDVNNLRYSIFTSLIDGNYDIIKMIYTSLVYNESIIAIDKNTQYYSKFNNNNFVLVYTKNFGDGLTITKEYVFTNMICSDDIVNAVLNKLYMVKYTFIKHMDVYGTIVGPTIGDGPKMYSYDDARTMIPIIAFAPLQQYILNDADFNPSLWLNVLLGIKADNIATVLDVNFARSLSIFTREKWVSTGFDTVIINGNNSYIYGATSDDDEFGWAEISEDSTFVISDLTIAQYNRAIKNLGSCILNNVHFDSNKMDYWFAKDYGAAIYNAGYCVCNNCSFTNGYAKYGAAIFNTGYLVLENCSFAGNHAYNHGDDVLNVGDGIVYYNGIKVVKGYYGPIAYTTDVSSTPLAILFTIAVGATLFVGMFATVIIGGAVSPIAGAIVGAFVLTAVIAMIVTYVEINEIDDVSASDYENYTPEIIDIEKYNMEYGSEVISAVSL